MLSVDDTMAAGPPVIVGHYEGGNHLFEELADMDYYMHSDTFLAYYVKCRRSPYSLIKRMTRDNRNIALGIVTNYNGIGSAVQINRHTRFPDDGAYINLSRGMIHRHINLITSYLDFGLKMRTTRREFSRRDILRNIRQQYSCVTREIENINDILNNTCFTYTEICNRQVFEEQLGLTWVDYQSF